MAIDFHIFSRQTWSLTKKILLITILRHPISTAFRALILPIAFLVLLLNIKNLLEPNSRYGFGSPAPVKTLKEAIPSSQKLVFVQPPGLGQDIVTVIDTITRPLQETEQLVYLNNETDLLTTCRQNLQGRSNCFAAVVFNDSPLTPGKKQTWTYTIHADNQYNGFKFHVNNHNNDEDRIYLPLQLAVENAITNSTIVPNQYMFTSKTQADQDTFIREQYQRLIISTYSIAFFISLLSPIYHSVSMITTERESGMAHLIDAMGGSPASRILSYVLAFNIIYTPCWILFGVLFWYELFRTSSVLISLFWQIFTGWAITSASVFSASFFKRAQLSGVYSVLGFLVFGVCGQLMDFGNPRTATVAVMSALFPSMNYMFMIGYMCRYEQVPLPTNLLRAADPTGNEASTSRLPGILLWVFLLLQTIFYPILGIFVERLIHGSKSRRRALGISNSAEGSSAVLEATGLTKTYPPIFWKKLTCRKVEGVVAIQNFDIVALRGQILCLLGVNGSGKTTTLDLLGGLQKPTSGSIRINATGSQIGICPQRNVMWDELTVDEHLHIWNEIKFSMQDKAELDFLVEACDLTPKKSARANTLSGGQKRKLQLACTFVGASSVCLLDEVTSGLDPLSRRIIWNVILAERAKRTIILTTHFLDEADVLADNVMIISDGHLKCQGSTAELKSQFGEGYQVHLQDTAAGPEMGLPIKRIRGQTIYTTPNSTGVVKLVSKLENMEYSEIFINGPTMEEVFLKVDQDSHVSEEGNVTEIDETTERELPLSAAQSGESSFLRQVRTLFCKRCTILLRNWWPYLIVLAMPLAVTPNLKTFLLFYKVPSCLDVTADVHNVEPFNFQLSGHQRLKPNYVPTGPYSINQSLYNVVHNFPVGVGFNIQNYSNEILLMSNFTSFQDYIAANYTDIAPGALYAESNTSAPTYAYLGDFGVFPALLMQNLWSQLRTGIPIVGYFSLFNSLISPTAGNSVQYIAYFCLAQAVYPALFALYPTYEKTRKVRALQYSNGIRAVPLWTAYLLFDFMFILVISIGCTVIVAVQSRHWFAPTYMFPVLILYGLAATLFAYVISLAARSQLGAFAYAAGIQALMFLLSIMTFALVTAFTNSNNITHALDGSAFGLHLIFPVGNLVRAMLVGLNVYLVNCRDGQLVTYPGSIYAYGGPILYLCLQICFLFWLLLWIEGNHSHLIWRRKQTMDHSEDHVHYISQEVANEKQRVETTELDLLRVLNLTKSFGSNVAVDDVSFGISQGEILALLGPNGAGKSTIINMIRRELFPDSGTILVNGIDMAKQVHLGRKYLGVCPQFDALDRMTTREHLFFYARAKGIAMVERDVTLVMERTGLKSYEHRLAAKLSGGNRRKLSLAIALLGNPLVLLLDEPSSSMDAASKRAMWRTLAQVTFGRSILLTTHSMEEADALATRAAIMSKRILVVGTTENLRQKYGNMYHVHLVLKTTPISSREEMDAVEEWVKGTFPDARFDSFGNFHGQIKFSVPATLSDERVADTDSALEGLGRKKSRVGALFSLLEENRDTIGLQFYSIRATTMEEVFLNVVKENNVREEGVIDGFTKKHSQWGWF